MESLTLVSGSVVALISAGLGYLVRASLDKRNIQNAERRIGYVHFVRISSLIAMEITLKAIFSRAVGDKIQQELAKSGNRFELSHAVSALIAKEAKKITEDKLNELAGFTLFSTYFKSVLDAMDDSKLSIEQLSELPRNTIQIYDEYLIYLGHLRGSLLMWIAFFEKKETFWVNAENIHNQWLAAIRFFDSAKRLRSALIEAKAVTTLEAAGLLNTQVDRYNRNFQAGLKHKQMLGFAVEDLEKSST